MALRDAASVSPAVFPANTEGLSLMKTFGSELVKARQYKAAQNKLAEAASLKFMDSKIQEGIDVDMQDYLLPKVDDLKKEWTKENINNDIAPATQYRLEQEMNHAVEESQLGQVQAQTLKANVALLHSDSDEEDKQKFDHPESQKRIEIIHDTPDWLSKHKDDPMWKKVNDDWNEIKSEPENKGLSDSALRYKFRTAHMTDPDYSLQPAKDSWDLTAYLKDAKPANITKGTSNPTGNFIEDNVVIGANKEVNAQRAQQMYATGKTKRGNPISQFLDDEYNKKLKEALDNNDKDFLSKPENQNAQTYGINQLYEGLNAKSPVSNITKDLNIPPTPSQKRSENTLILPPSKPEQTTYVKDDGSTDTLPTEGGNAFGDAPTNKSFSGAIEYGNGSFKEDEGQAVKGDLTKIGIIDFGGKLGKQPVAFIAKDGKRNDIVYVPLKGSAIDDVIEYMNDKNILLYNSDDDMYKPYLGYSINDYVKKKQGDGGSEQQTKTTGTVR